MPSIRFLKSSTLGGGNTKGQELAKHEEMSGEQVDNRQKTSFPESLFADLAKSPFDAHHLDTQAAMTLLELANGGRIPADSSMVASNGGVPLSEDNGSASVGGTGGSRPASSFTGTDMPDPSTIVSTPFEDTQAVVALFSARLNQTLPLRPKPDSNPVATAPFEDVEAAVTLFSIYLDQTHFRDATLE